tara:strand:+ start:131 stop:1036 length:906 start_codon:yes stop_codon:yes gene_type:complete
MSEDTMVLGKDMVFADTPSKVAFSESELQRFVSKGSIEFSGPDSKLVGLRQQAPLRFLFPELEDIGARSIVLVNTAGGIVGGDDLTYNISAKDGAKILVTGQACEKVYGSAIEPAKLKIKLEARKGSVLEFLPQGTIFFNKSSLERRTTISIEADAHVLFGELMYFGRTAMAEKITAGRIIDQTDVWFDGQRVLFDSFRLTHDEYSATQCVAGLNGATCSGLLLLMAPNPKRNLDYVLKLLKSEHSNGVIGGASLMNSGLIVVRWLGHNAALVRQSFGNIWGNIRAHALGRPNILPSIWAI